MVSAGQYGRRCQVPRGGRRGSVHAHGRPPGQPPPVSRPGQPPLVSRRPEGRFDQPCRSRRRRRSRSLNGGRREVAFDSGPLFHRPTGLVHGLRVSFSTDACHGWHGWHGWHGTRWTFLLLPRDESQASARQALLAPALERGRTPPVPHAPAVAAPLAAPQRGGVAGREAGAGYRPAPQRPAPSHRPAV